MFYAFRQRNSGGSHVHDDAAGIGPRVWIEAASASDANVKAEAIGIYFNGAKEGSDCPCCGDRWHPVTEHDAETRPNIYMQYDFAWHPAVIYVHRADGSQP